MLRLFVDIAPRPNVENGHYLPCVVDAVNDAVVSDTDTKHAAKLALHRFAPVRARIVGERADCGGDASMHHGMHALERLRCGGIRFNPVWHGRSLPVSKQFSLDVLPRGRIATFTYRGFGSCDVSRVFGFDLRDDGARASDAIGDSAARVSDCIVVRPEHRQAHSSQRMGLIHLLRQVVLECALDQGDESHQHGVVVVAKILILSQDHRARGLADIRSELLNLFSKLSIHLDDVEIALSNLLHPRIRRGGQGAQERGDASLYLRQKRKRLLEHVGGHGLILTERRALRNGRALEAS
jgi:hypothetical protein